MEIMSDDRLVTSKMSAAVQNGKLRLGFPEDTAAEKAQLMRKHGRSVETEEVMSTVYNPEESAADSDNLEFPATFCQQLGILIKRRLLQQSRNKLIIGIMLGHHIMSSVLIGIIFYAVGNNASKPFENFKSLISCTIFFLYTHLMVNVLLYPFEVETVKREYFNRWYGLKSYYASHILTTIPPQVIFGFQFMSVVYLLTDQPLEIDRFAWCCLTGILTGLASEGLGLTIGAIFKVKNGSVVGAAVAIPLFVIAVYGMGFGENIEPGMEVLMSMSYMRYGIIALSTAAYRNREPLYCPPEEIYCHYQNLDYLLRDVGMINHKPYWQVLGLVCFIIFYRLTAFLALRHRLTVQFSNNLLISVSKILGRSSSH